MAGPLARDTRQRRLILALAIYGITTAVYFACATRSTIRQHTPWNHYALLAEAWLNHRLDLGQPPPGYAGNNDFAEYRGKWFVTFPPFPAVLLLPLVKFGKSAVRVQDGQFFLWLAGLGPALLLLALEKLRRMGRGRSTLTNFELTLLFAFGSVYFFTAEQGTVWFAAHVVGVALAALYLRCALDAEHPILAGTALGLGFLTRPPLLFAAPLFLLEALRVATRASTVRPSVSAGEAHQLELPLEERAKQLALPLPATDPPSGANPSSAAPNAHAARNRAGLRAFAARAVASWKHIDTWRLFRLYAAFAGPILIALALYMVHNALRFGDPFESGYRYLTVAWRPRMERWGLFSYHYLARNLGVVLTSLPWMNSAPTAATPFQINLHGLALWLTTPAYLWLLFPRRTDAPHLALWLTVAAVAVPTLFYQNTGWLQFGYRFSNDYAPILFALLAIGGYRFGALFSLAALWAVAINAFGAVTFGRPQYQRFYYQDASQHTVYQPD